MVGCGLAVSRICAGGVTMVDSGPQRAVPIWQKRGFALCAALVAWLLGAAATVRASETWATGDLAEAAPEEAAASEPDFEQGSGREPATPLRGFFPPSPPPDLDVPPNTRPDEYAVELLRRCGNPTLERAMDAAVAFAELAAGTEETVLNQARWAALLPRVRVWVRRDWERDESLDLEPDPTAGRFRIDTDDDLELGVSAQWDLAAIVAPPAAPTARRLALQAAAARRALRLEVAATYLEWCRLRVEWSAATDNARRAEIAWAIAERTARLNALTGGLFGRQAEASPGGAGRAE